MISSNTVLTGSYNYGLVALSVLVGMSASYAALDLGGRTAAARGWVRLSWLAGGAAAMGFGIWAMHFTGMLAFSLPVPVGYDWPIVLLSLAIAIFSSAVALYVVSRPKMGIAKTLTGSVIMGAGIAALHYVGMAAMRLAAECRFSPLLVTVAIALAILISFPPLWLVFHFREETLATPWSKIASAIVLGAAISVMHYTGMASASFLPSPLPPDLSHAVSISTLGTIAIAIVTLMVQAFAVLTSIVDRRFAAQTYLQQSSEQQEQQSRALIDAIPQQIWSGPADGSLDFCNERWRSYMGLGLAELAGEGWQSMLHPDDRERVLKAWHESVTMGTPYEQEERHRGVDGTYRWFLARGLPMCDAEGRIVRWYGTNTDIEDLKRAEEAVIQAEDRIRLIIDTIPTMVWTLQPDGAIDFVNQRWMDYTGLSLEEEMEEPTRPVHPEDLPGVVEKWLADMAAGEPSEDEMRLRRADGEYRRFLVRTAPLRDKQGNLVKWFGLSIDIEDRKRAEEELQRLSGQLLRLQDEERRKIARDLHDSTGQDLVALATTLSQLHASTPLSARKLRKLSSQCLALADQCIREVRTLSYLLHPPMLDEAGLEDAVRHYVGGFTERTGIEIELEISPRFGRMRPDVEMALFRVVQESLTNIQRHSGSLRAEIRMNCGPKKVTLEVSDRGSGISGILPRRDEDSPFRIGVGIASMQERVKLIGGRLNIESGGSGTTVRVTIPVNE